jgi:hypothetical protein
MHTVCGKIRKKIPKNQETFSLQATRAEGFRDFLNPQICWVDPADTVVVNQTLASPGFGPPGVHPQAFGPEGRRAPLAM